jgi:hypothetical protein
MEGQKRKADTRLLPLAPPLLPVTTGMGLQDAQANAFVARLPNMLLKMSILHAVYGLLLSWQTH